MARLQSFVDLAKVQISRRGVMVALDPSNVTCMPLVGATNRMKIVPLDSDTILTARDLGINFGDQTPLP